MPHPKAICLEDLDAAPGSVRYVRCVALAGGQPGLTLDPGGDALWQSEEPVSCQLWVSLDERLILLRPAGARPVTVARAGRSLEAPFDKPVVLLDQDEVEVGGRRLRIHVHGEAADLYPPSPLEPERQDSRLAGVARAAAMGLALGAALGASGCKSGNNVEPDNNNIHVREVPPSPPPPPPPPPDAAVKAGADLKASPTVAPSKVPIEVRSRPPGPSATPRRRPSKLRLKKK